MNKIELIAIIISSIASISAATAAVAACLGLKKTKDASLAQLIIKLQDEYLDPEMKLAREKIIEWIKKYPDNFAKTFTQIRSKDFKSIEAYDLARRKTKSYYLRIYDFFVAGLLNEKLIKKLLVSEEKAFFLLNYIVPIEIEMNPRTPSIVAYDFYRKIYPNPKVGLLYKSVTKTN